MNAQALGLASNFAQGRPLLGSPGHNPEVDTLILLYSYSTQFEVLHCCVD